MNETPWNADVWGTVPDWIMAITALVAAFLAYSSLHSWRVQDRQRWDNDLAKRLLIALWRYRRSFSYVRSPFAGGDASILTDEERKGVPPIAHNRLGMIKDYSERFRRLEESKDEVSALLEEAKVFWKDISLDAVSSIFKLQTELVVYFRTLFNSMDDGNPAREELREDYWRRMRSKRDIQFEVEGDMEDAFRIELDAAFKDFEDQVRSRIANP